MNYKEWRTPFYKKGERRKANSRKPIFRTLLDIINKTLYE